MAGGYKAYPYYKDSGVEWIGVIPSTWDMWKIAHSFPYVASGTTPKSDSESYYGGENLWVTTGELREGVIVDTKKRLTDKALLDLPTLRLHPSGSVAIAMYGATIGRLGIFGEAATTNQACCVMPPSETIYNKYLFYWLFATRDEIINLSSGGGQPNVNQEKISSLKISAPSLPEQKQIARFLDHETGKIDALIEKQQALIALLQEKRQAVISHAVTKGLNPDAKMKDSGVEWLGEVPEHWEVKRLKNTSEVVDCRNKTPDYVDGGKYFVVRTTNVKQEQLSHVGALYTDEASFRIWTQRGIPKVGSIFFTREAPAGEVCLVPDGVDLCMGQRMMNFICHDDAYTGYLFDFLLSDCLDRYIESVSHGSTVSHLRVEQVENIPVLVPPASEIEEILGQLRVIKSSFRELTCKAESAIELMQERRTALISAAVTGKIDVRDWELTK